MAPHKEVSSLFPGSRSQLANIFLLNWERGQPTALDVTVISLPQQLTLVGAATIPDYSLVIGGGNETHHSLRPLPLHRNLFHSPGRGIPAWEAGVRKQSTPSAALAGFSAIAQAPPQVNPPDTSFIGNYPLEGQCQALD